MIPGTTSKVSESRVASAATIFPKSDVVYVSGSTAIVNIVPPYEGFSGLLFVVATGAGLATTTAGNIQSVVAFPQNKVTVLVYSKLNTKWYSTV